MKDLEILIKREFKILFVSVKQILSYSSFFLLVFLLFAFSIGPNQKNALSSIYLPILFMIILFSLILTSENFIDEDFKNGGFKELQFLGFSPELIFLAKSFSMFSSIIFSNFFFNSHLLAFLFGISFSIHNHCFFYFFTIITYISSFIIDFCAIFLAN